MNSQGRTYYTWKNGALYLILVKGTHMGLTKDQMIVYFKDEYDISLEKDNLSTRMTAVNNTAKEFYALERREHELKSKLRTTTQAMKGPAPEVVQVAAAKFAIIKKKLYIDVVAHPDCAVHLLDIGERLTTTKEEREAKKTATNTKKHDSKAKDDVLYRKMKEVTRKKGKWQLSSAPAARSDTSSSAEEEDDDDIVEPKEDSKKARPARPVQLPSSERSRLGGAARGPERQCADDVVENSMRNGARLDSATNESVKILEQKLDKFTDKMDRFLDVMITKFG